MRFFLAGCAFVLAAAPVACGGNDDGPGQNDERIRQIAGIAAAATYAYAATNGEGLLDYVTANIAENCTKEDINRALVDEPVPTGFKSLKDVRFDGDRASATVVMAINDGEEEQEWTFVREDGESWRIETLSSLSLEDCRIR